MELPKIDAAYAEHQRQTAALEGVQAVERELFPGEPGREAVEICLWVRGREIRTIVDNETIHRIVALLVGEAP